MPSMLRYSLMIAIQVSCEIRILKPILFIFLVGGIHIALGLEDNMWSSYLWFFLRWSHSLEEELKGDQSGKPYLPHGYKYLFFFFHKNSHKIGDHYEIQFPPWFFYVTELGKDSSCLRTFMRRIKSKLSSWQSFLFFFKGEPSTVLPHASYEHY